MKVVSSRFVESCDFKFYHWSTLFYVNLFFCIVHVCLILVVVDWIVLLIFVWNFYLSHFDAWFDDLNFLINFLILNLFEIYDLLLSIWLPDFCFTLCYHFFAHWVFCYLIHLNVCINNLFLTLTSILTFVYLITSFVYKKFLVYKIFWLYCFYFSFSQFDSYFFLLQ